MTSPTIPDLPTASVANNSDEMLIRQPAGVGGVDKKVTVDKLRNIDISALPQLPSGQSTPQVTDLMILRRGSSNYQVPFSQVGFPSGTKMWFGNATAPLGWTTDVATQDQLIGVKSASGAYQNVGSNRGDWTLPDHTLTVQEMPTHNHFVDLSGATTSTFHPDSSASISDGGAQTKTTAAGGNQPHNHGDTFRPLAAIGILAVKD